MTKRVFKVLKISNIDFCSLSLTSFSIESILVGCEKHSQTLYENNLESLFCLYNKFLKYKLHCIVEKITNYRRKHLFIFYVSMRHLTTNYFERKTI